MREKCDVPNCSEVTYMQWYKKTICKKHWHLHCDDTKKWNLHSIFDIDKIKNKNK